MLLKKDILRMALGKPDEKATSIIPTLVIMTRKMKKNKRYHITLPAGRTHKQQIYDCDTRNDQPTKFDLSTTAQHHGRQDSR